MKRTFDLSLVLGFAASLGILSAPAAFAEEAEDSSAAFEASKEALAATLGTSTPESTVTTHENGMTSAVVGLSTMKMLVVKQNDDGTLSSGHASSEEDVEAFVTSESTQTLEEK